MKRGKLGLVLVVLAVVAGIALVSVPGSPVRGWLVALAAWARDAGPAGAAAFAAVYIVATVLLVPASVLTAGAGFAYGPLWGLLLISPVSVAAATAAFLVGRHFAREKVKARVGKDGRFAAVERAISQRGLRTVLLLRLSPIFPFNLLNYALGITDVRLRDYVLGSFLGMLPGTAVYVGIGAAVTNASELASGGQGSSPWKLALLAAGLVATVVVTVWIGRSARRQLRLEESPHA